MTETGMFDCKLAETPMKTNQQLGISLAKQLTDKVYYQQLVGNLIYLTHTRPDIAYVVSLVSQIMQAPSIEHMNAVHRISKKG